MEARFVRGGVASETWDCRGGGDPAFVHRKCSGSCEQQNIRTYCLDLSMGKLNQHGSVIAGNVLICELLRQEIAEVPKPHASQETPHFLCTVLRT